MNPVKITWAGGAVTLDGNMLEPGTEGVLIGNGLAAWPTVSTRLWSADAKTYTVVDDGTDGPLGGWNGTTVTPDLIRAMLAHPEAVPTIVQLMQEDPELGPRIVEAVMGSMG